MLKLISFLSLFVLALASRGQWSVTKIFRSDDTDCGGDPILEFGSKGEGSCTPFTCQGAGGTALYEVSCHTSKPDLDPEAYFVVQEFSDTRCRTLTSYLSMMPGECAGDNSEWGFTFDAECSASGQSYALTSCDTYDNTCDGDTCYTDTIDTDDSCQQWDYSTSSDTQSYIATGPCNDPIDSPCDCSSRNQCNCCDSYEIPNLLSATSCTNFTYNGAERAFEVTYSINGYEIWSGAIPIQSDRDTQECFTAEGLPSAIGQVCITLYDISSQANAISACALTEFQTPFKTFEYPIGCFTETPRKRALAPEAHAFDPERFSILKRNLEKTVAGLREEN